MPGEVTTAEFDSICSWLRQWCSVMPLQQAADALREGTLPSRAVTITFDDGYRDNHGEALPVLKRHGLSATFFIASGFLDGGRMWNDTVIESIRRSPSSTLDLAGTPLADLGSFSLDDDEARRRAIAALIGRVKYLPPDERQRCVTILAERASAQLPTDLMMSRTEVAALHAAGMTIGAHTRNHPILRGLGRDDVATEIEENCRDLQSITGRRPSLFAYPNGRPGVDYDDATRDVVKEFGFSAAVSTAWRAARASDDLLQLPRYMPWERTRARFAIRLAHTLATT
ncbi:polysaccharide deacetylase family protein [Roseateles sp.]|uniref:polysaccharide deacetylase family protein n=1 Tax=Roseateles sp. TaxID=1971397 RepID=UPI003BA4D885